MKTRKVFFRKKRQEFFLSFFDVVGNCSGNKTDLRIEYAGDEEERHIIYSSFLQLHKEESTIPRQLLAGGPPFLSRKELRFACFPFAELLNSCRPMSLGSCHPANLLIRTDSKQSLENRNGSRSEVCLSNRLRLCSLCALAHPSFLSLYLRMRSSGADPTVYPLDIRRSMAISLNTS